MKVDRLIVRLQARANELLRKSGFSSGPTFDVELRIGDVVVPVADIVIEYERQAGNPIVVIVGK